MTHLHIAVPTKTRFYALRIHVLKRKNNFFVRGVSLIHANGILIFVFIGKYMYTEATARWTGDNAKLQLVVPRSTLNSCLTFFYHMYGQWIGTLNVFNGNTTIFTASGDHGDNWIKVTRTVNSSDVVSMPILCGSA